MPTQNECLTQAMYIAAESYSGSDYGYAFNPAEMDCDEADQIDLTLAHAA